MQTTLQTRRSGLKAASGLRGAGGGGEHGHMGSIPASRPQPPAARSPPHRAWLRRERALRASSKKYTKINSNYTFFQMYYVKIFKTYAFFKVHVVAIFKTEKLALALIDRYSGTHHPVVFESARAPPSDQC